MLEVTELEGNERDDGLGVWQGDTRLYRLSETISTRPTVEDYPMTQTDHIVVSAIEFEHPESLQNVKQTYIFPSDSKGWPLDMVHLKGSIDGRLDHKRAIMNFIGQHMKMEETDGCN